VRSRHGLHGCVFYVWKCRFQHLHNPASMHILGDRAYMVSVPPTTRDFHYAERLSCDRYRCYCRSRDVPTAPGSHLAYQLVPWLQLVLMVSRGLIF
jgi:hypothetical protein